MVSSVKCIVVNKAGDTPAHIACREGNVEKLKELCEHFNNNGILEIKNKIGKVPLHDAVLSGKTECLRFLLDRRVEKDALKRGDWTPLMLACTKSSLDVIRFLVERGCNLTPTNKDGWNCLHLAVRKGHVEIVKYLMETDLSIVLNKSKNLRTPLHTAALHGHREVTKLLMESGLFDPDVRDVCGVTPLMDAVRSNHVPVVTLLVQTFNANIHLQDFIGGRQAIHLSAESGAQEALDYLVRDCCISVNCRSAIFSETPLHLAAKEGHATVVKQLLEFGADRTQLDSKARTAFQVAVVNKRTECTQLLLADRMKD